MRPIYSVVFLLMLSLASTRVAALVNFDQGQRIIKGVQLLQDFNDAAAYYYVPQFPRLSTKEDGSLEFLCLKFVDQAGGTNGGLFHALVEFTLPPDLLAAIEKELRKAVPGARIVGPVPLMQVNDNSQDGVGSFQVVSSILSDRSEKGGFTRTLITSGKAPLTPGSKAVVAAILNQQGATLLWDSLSGPTSDVSVSIHAYYEAAVQGYNAKVTADSLTVYEHFSRIANKQQEFTRRQLRDIVDDLQRKGALKVEVLDRTASLGIKASEMDGLLQVVTTKLTDLMFDHKTGWAADPTREAAVEADQIKGRQERGWFSRTFGGAQDTPYFTDDQYVIKKRKDIRHNTFSLVLSKNSTIKVPVDTAGNIAGLYSALKKDSRYFRVVNLADPDFEFREIRFQIDNDFIDSFKDTINFVTVSVRKTYKDRPAFTKSLVLNSEDVIAKGKAYQEISLPRLGADGTDWMEYEYQVRWSMRDAPTLSVPADENRWIRSKDRAVSLLPPFAKRIIEIEADRQLFKERRVVTAVVELTALVASKPKVQRKVTLRATDAEPVVKVAVYHDRDTPVGQRIVWHSPERSVAEKLRLVDADYLLIVPPNAAVRE